MKTAIVYLYDRLAGRLTEDENGFTFLYDPDFLASDGEAVEYEDRQGKKKKENC